MSVLVPCPGCGMTRQADEGHHLCRQCEGYDAALAAHDDPTADEVQRIRWAMERSAVRTSEAEAEVASMRVRLAAAEALLRRARPYVAVLGIESATADIDAFLAGGVSDA